MATHATLGADLGKIIRGDSVADKILNGGAAVAIDGLNQLEVEVEARWMGSDPERNLVGAAYVAAIRRFRAAVNGFRRDLIFRVARLWAFQIARPDLDSTGKNMTDILHDLTLAMRVDSKPVQQNAITTSAVTAYGTNTGDGTLVLYDENPLDKRDEERIQSQHVIFQCRQDVRRGNTTAGAEIFEVQSSLHGKLPDVKVGWNEAVDQNRITNGSFDTFTVADTPTNWTETTGAANSTEEASLVYRTGGKALKVTADGAATAYNASQAETAFVSYASQRLKPLGVYLLSVRLRRGAAADMTGTLAIQFSGTGYTPGTGEKVEVTTLTTSYVLYTAKIVMPKSIPSDMALQILWNGTPTAARIVYLDDLCLQEMTYADKAGFRYALVRGATDFVQGPKSADRFDADFTNPYTGLYQTWLSRVTDPDDPDGDTWPGIHRAAPSDAAANADYAEAQAQ